LSNTAGSLSGMKLPALMVVVVAIVVNRSRQAQQPPVGCLRGTSDAGVFTTWLTGVLGVLPKSVSIDESVTEAAGRW
jgi:hypothetical protein